MAGGFDGSVAAGEKMTLTFFGGVGVKWLIGYLVNLLTISFITTCDVSKGRGGNG